MPTRRITLAAADAAEIGVALDNLRASLAVSQAFAPDVVAEAEQVASAPTLPDLDLTDIPFVTIDPPDSLDLDQALHLERLTTGYRVRYAIADVASFVPAGGALDLEAHARGQTLYAPDGNARLYPPALSEGAASLLPDELRPAVVWDMQLDETGEGIAVQVRRAQVRSRQKLSYETVQTALDAGSADEPLRLLAEVGQLRQAREVRRGGITLPIPEQVVERRDDGYELAFRAPLAVEGWNAQISLMAGQAAAELMLGAEVGVLRTLPKASRRALARLRRTAEGLGVRWERGVAYPAFIRGLDPTVPAEAAVLAEATAVLRGSSYAAFDDEVPTAAGHAGVGAPYAHTTAPLRRLVDRYVLEVCVATSAGVPVPDWVRQALPTLPETMDRSNRRAQQFEAGVVSTVEAAVLEPHVGKAFTAVVVDVDEHADNGPAGTVQLREPAVTARCVGELPLGEEVRVRLVLADVVLRQVRFELASEPVRDSTSKIPGSGADQANRRRAPTSLEPDTRNA